MQTRERILTIRLLEKYYEHPAYAKMIGLEVSREMKSAQKCKNLTAREGE